MALTLSLLLFAMVATALFAFGAAIVTPASMLGLRLRTLLGNTIEHKGSSAPERLERALNPLSKALPRSPGEISRTRAWLMQAGYRDDSHLTIYYGIRVLFALALLSMLVVTDYASRSMLLTAGLPAFGYFLPRFMLKRKIAARQHRIRLALPDALDLTVICVEVGLGLDQSLQRVGQELRHVHPALSDEFELVHLEMRAGRARTDALRNLALRTGVDDIRALVAVLIQTDRFGTSVTQALRVHSDSLRTERRQRAEEIAAKTTIKMVPVLVFFVFPAMFCVTLGPAAIALYRNLLPVIQK